MKITLEIGDTFADRLKFTRRQKELTQAELSKLTGIAPATLSSYEIIKGTKSPPLNKVIAIAKILNVSLDWLCGMSNDMPEWMRGENNERDFIQRSDTKKR